MQHMYKIKDVLVCLFINYLLKNYLHMLAVFSFFRVKVLSMLLLSLPQVFDSSFSDFLWHIWIWFLIFMIHVVPPCFLTLPCPLVLKLPVCFTLRSLDSLVLGIMLITALQYKLDFLMKRYDLISEVSGMRFLYKIFYFL